MRASLILVLLICVVGCEQNNQSEVVFMKISSPEFFDLGRIPDKYTCNGEGISPPLAISDVPLKAQSLALINDDPDASSGEWVHWIVWNIDPNTTFIREGSVPGVQGLNDFRQYDYGGPCPPSGTHRYFFKLYALDTKLSISESSRKRELEKAMKGHVIAEARLIGVYSK